MEQNKRIIQQFIEQTLNQGDLEATHRFVHDDAVEMVPFPGQGPGAEGIKQVIAGMRAAFADLHWTILEQVAEGEMVVTRFEWTGTHRAEFLGVPATGRGVRVWGVVIDRLVAGKVKETRLIMDAVGMLAQLGVLPQP